MQMMTFYIMQLSTIQHVTGGGPNLISFNSTNIQIQSMLNIHTYEKIKYNDLNLYLISSYIFRDITACNPLEVH
jgi:hypothetical protein